MEALDKKLKDLLATPLDVAITPADVAPLTERCPAFLTPYIALLRHPHPDLDDRQVETLIHRVALSLPDLTRLRALIDPDGTGCYDRFYPSANNTAAATTTDDVIHTFLDIYGHTSPEEEALISRMIFNPVPDYAATLQQEMPAPAAPVSEQDRLLDAFIAADTARTTPAAADLPADAATPAQLPPVEDTTTPAVETIPSVEPPATASRPVPPGSSLSESLARIFIKQHNYKRAYEIIESLSLNYPEKSVYFADQLRFLGKIIKNREAQEKLKNIKN